MTFFKLHEINADQNVYVDYSDASEQSGAQNLQEPTALISSSSRAGQRRLRVETNINKINFLTKQKLDINGLRKILDNSNLNQDVVNNIINRPDRLNYVIHLAHNSQTLSNIALYMLNYDIDLESRDVNGFTPLQLAISVNQGYGWFTPIIDHLIANGADIKAVNSNTGDSCIHYAAASGSLDLVALFIIRGVDPKKENFKGNSAMHSAALSKKNSPEIIKLLLKHGLSVNQQNVNGETPLYLAASQGNLSAVRTLVDLGAQVKTSPSALEIAIINKRQDVVKYLIEKGGI